MRLQHLSDHIVQPGGPLVQRALLLQGDLKILLQTLNHALVTLTHPWGLLLLRTRSARKGETSARDASGPRHAACTPLEQCGEDGQHLYLNISKVHPVEVRQHLVDLWGILEDGAGRLGQVVQTGVTSQRLGKGADHRHLHQGGAEHDHSRCTQLFAETRWDSFYLGADNLLRKVGHGIREPALQAFSKVTNGLSESTWTNTYFTTWICLCQCTIRNKQNHADSLHLITA